MRQYVVGLLQKYCDVLSCEDGAHALAELRAKPHDYDLVLSDDLMPNMTGPELLSIVRAEESTRTIPFIIVSANAGDGARMDGLALGADDYISKPFQARELLLRVHTQLQSASIRSRLQLQMDEQMRCLEESRESFTRLCERLQVGIHRSDPEGRMIWYVLGLYPGFCTGIDTHLQGKSKVEERSRSSHGRVLPMGGRHPSSRSPWREEGLRRRDADQDGVLRVHRVSSSRRFHRRFVDRRRLTSHIHVSSILTTRHRSYMISNPSLQPTNREICWAGWVSGPTCPTSADSSARR
jgi:CheY-like chemotaxis protein